MPDQAAGLRSLFAHGGPNARPSPRPSLLIVAGSDARKADIAAHFAREAAAASRATVLIDGSAGRLASACGVSCRFELAHVLAGDMQLAGVLKVLTPHLLLLPAARALSRYGSFAADEEERLSAAFSSGIADAFAGAGTPDAQVDLIVVNAGEGEGARAVAAFGRDARVVIVASDHAASLRGAYAEMKLLSQDQGLENFEIVVPVADDAANSPANNQASTGVTFNNLANAARRFLDIELVDGGTVSVAAAVVASPNAHAGASRSPNSIRHSTPAPCALSATAAGAASFRHATEEVPHAAIA